LIGASMWVRDICLKKSWRGYREKNLIEKSNRAVVQCKVLAGEKGKKEEPKRGVKLVVSQTYGCFEEKRTGKYGVHKKRGEEERRG